MVYIGLHNSATIAERCFFSFSDPKDHLEASPWHVREIMITQRCRSCDSAGLEIVAGSRPCPGVLSPGARFSKLPVITGLVKLFCFPFLSGEFQKV